MAIHESSSALPGPLSPCADTDPGASPKVSAMLAALKLTINAPEPFRKSRREKSSIFIVLSPVRISLDRAQHLSEYVGLSLLYFWFRCRGRAIGQRFGGNDDAVD